MPKKAQYQNTIFAFNADSGSIGWCVLGGRLSPEDKIIPEKIIDSGVRIFHNGLDPKTKESLAFNRTIERQKRKLLIRAKRRRNKLVAILTANGLMPASYSDRRNLIKETNYKKNASPENTPYALRVRALDEKLPLYYIGRILYTLNKRRGFKSNRKIDNRKNDLGPVLLGVEKLYSELDVNDYRTLGEFYLKRLRDGKNVRNRVYAENILEDTDESFFFYPDRAMLLDEFNKIWEKQNEFYPDVLTNELKKTVSHLIFHQNSLKSVKPGFCLYNNDEPRLAKAHPLFQKFRLYKTVNELTREASDSGMRIKLTLNQRDELIDILQRQKNITFSTIRKKLNLDGRKFLVERNSKTHILGDEIYGLFRKPEYFGEDWTGFSIKRQWEIIKTIKDEESPIVAKDWLEKEFPFLKAEQYDNILKYNFPAGYCRIGEAAISELLAEMEDEVISEAAAVIRCGYDHALTGRANEGEIELPKYQNILTANIIPGTGNIEDGFDVCMGRLGNISGHILLNQLRLLVNSLLAIYGKPQEIVIKTTKNLELSQKQRVEFIKNNNKNTKLSQKHSELLKNNNIPDTGLNRQIIRLWEELGKDENERRCPYSGRLIPFSLLFNGSVGIDYILPISRTLDNSNANKIVAFAQFIREKAGLAPAEVENWDQDALLERAQSLPENKRWRFSPNVMNKFEKNDYYLDRQFIDSQYIGSMLIKYLASLYPGQEENYSGVMKMKRHVNTFKSQFINPIRHFWGLNKFTDEKTGDFISLKNDFRSTIIDAVIIGVISRSSLLKITKAMKYNTEQGFADYMERAFQDNVPWVNFKADLKKQLERVIVSHKLDRGSLPTEAALKSGKAKTSAELLKRTNYGIPTDKDGKRLLDDNGKEFVFWRIPFLSLRPEDIANIRDRFLASRLETYIWERNGSLAGGAEFKNAIIDFRKEDEQYKNIKHVRVIGNLSVKIFKDKENRIYKGNANARNHSFIIWELKNGEWISEVLTMIDAHQLNGHSVSPIQKLHPTAKKRMTLQNNDAVIYYDKYKDTDIVARVIKISGNGAIYFAPHNEANASARSINKNDKFKLLQSSVNTLKKMNLRKVYINELGKIIAPKHGK